jgi:hypothetical protein|nr:MAG TPA: hypothetical protein [Caudoviricetes sp.]DAX43583.1 MAG TPA: hypothetical protein [Caudoviricetes sp.]
MLEIVIIAMGVFLIALFWEKEEKGLDILPILKKAIIVLSGFMVILLFPVLSGIFLGILLYKGYLLYKDLTKDNTW